MFGNKVLFIVPRPLNIINSWYSVLLGIIILNTSIRATLYACFMPFQLFFEKFLRDITSSIETFRKIIKLDKA